jgi:hypothetical protein
MKILGLQLLPRNPSLCPDSSRAEGTSANVAEDEKKKHLTMLYIYFIN